MNKTKTIYYATLALTTLLVTSLLVYAPFTTLNPVFMAGTQVETASYVVWREGNSYYAKSGDSGEVEYSGANASGIIQNCLSVGNTVFIRRGTYVLNYDLYMDNQTRLYGESVRNYDDEPIPIDNYATILQLNSSTVTSLIRIESDVWGVEFRDVWLWGNNHLGTGIHGIYTQGISVFCHNVKIFEFSGSGVLGSGDGANARGLMQINDCEIGYNTQAGIMGSFGHADNWISDTNINANGWYGVYLGAGSGMAISGGHIEWNIYEGIFANQTGSLIVSGVRFDRNYLNAIQLSQASYSLIDGNYFYRNAQNEGGAIRSHITNFRSNNTVITDNTFRAEYTANLYPFYSITAYESNNVTITGNEVSNGGLNQSHHIHFWDIANFTIKDNHGFITENTGFATVANGEWVLHGLDGSLYPTYLSLTDRTSLYDGVPIILSWANQNTTHFQVGVIWSNSTLITDDAINIAFYAVYKPM